MICDIERRVGFRGKKKAFGFRKQTKLLFHRNNIEQSMGADAGHKYIEQSMDADAEHDKGGINTFPLT